MPCRETYGEERLEFIMGTIKAVAHVGASGFIGTPVLMALIDSGFDVTVLTRQKDNADFPSSVKVAQIDYSNRESVILALKDQDALVSTVGVRAIEEQYKLIDAAAEAGVRRFVPVCPFLQRISS